MNCFFVTGKLFNEPKSSFLRISKSEELFIVKFCLAVPNDYMFFDEDEDCDDLSSYNFFQCVAFDDVGKEIVDCFTRGVRVNIQAIVQNFPFKDSNGTPHFTHILLINQMEYNEDASSNFKIASQKKKINKVLVDEISHIDDLFKEVCDKGFLCINEDDYYNMAISNMVI